LLLSRVARIYHVAGVCVGEVTSDELLSHLPHRRRAHVELIAEVVPLCGEKV
jgi:hypothetical protein